MNNYILFDSYIDGNNNTHEIYIDKTIKESFENLKITALMLGYQIISYTAKGLKSIKHEYNFNLNDELKLCIQFVFSLIDDKYYISEMIVENHNKYTKSLTKETSFFGYKNIDEVLKGILKNM